MAKTIGDRIGELVAKGWDTQREAAEAFGVHPALLSRWITNEERPPGEETIRMIAETCGSTPWWIRYGVGSETTSASGPGGPVSEVVAIAEECATLESLLRHMDPEETLRAAYRAAMSEGWGVDAIRRLTEIAIRLLGSDSIGKLLG